MNLRYMDSARPDKYISASGVAVLDPTRGHLLVEDGHSRTNDPEICAWRVYLTVRGMQEQFRTHPLAENDALDYESELRSMAVVAATEMRPVYGYPKSRDSYGPKAGEKWLWHQGRADRSDVAHKVAYYLQRAFTALENGDSAAFANLQMTAAFHAKEVACSDYQVMVQALNEVGLPAIPCKNPLHENAFHADPQEVA